MPALITWWTLDLARLAPHAPPERVAALGADLLRRWNEPQRHYHTTSHLVEMFWALEELEVKVLPPQGAVLARVGAWFHDAVYDPRAGGGANEAASAQLAAAALGGLGAGADAVDTVERLIRMTDGHDDDDGDNVSQAFHDADLWILSAPAARFDAYCGQVRAEYAHVPDGPYAGARSQILRDLVRRDRLYLTGHAQQEWDEAARTNLGRELQRLARR